MKIDQVRSTLKSIVEKVLETHFEENDFISLSIAGIGFTSITFIKLLVEIEMYYDIEFEDDMLVLSDKSTIDNMVNMIMKKTI